MFSSGRLQLRAHAQPQKRIAAFSAILPSTRSLGCFTNLAKEHLSDRVRRCRRTDKHIHANIHTRRNDRTEYFCKPRAAIS
uniref:Uncharacterized protein n=1 Tax=Trichogramma kaykai TaxID=54128 RepID=A0ABD2W1E4_9HYME